MTLPNFLILGAQKAGTTSLFDYLGQHPEVYPSPIKETHFFDHGGVRQTYAGPVRIPGPKIKSLEEYEGLFDGVRDEKAVGEATPTYLYLPGVAERIRHHVPEARLIAILRDPVERAYSGYQHAVRNGRERLRRVPLSCACHDAPVAARPLHRSVRRRVAGAVLRGRAQRSLARGLGPAPAGP